MRSLEISIVAHWRHSLADQQVFRQFAIFLGLAVFSVAIFALAYFSPANQGNADSHFSLIVSQAILEHRTIQLDDYETQIPEQFAKYARHGLAQISEINGRTYYRYPLGSSIFSLPVVWAARQFWGKDMLVMADNHQTQNGISALICTAVFLLLYAIGRSYVSPSASMIIAGVSVLGSALISSMGSALWSVDFTVFCQLLVLWAIVRYEEERSRTINPYGLGLLLFAAFFSRPTAAVFIGLFFLYLLIYHRHLLLKTALTAAGCLLLFLLWSWVEYGRLVPAYYEASTWIKLADVRRALYGILFSPSRGLFIYSPFFLLTVLGTMRYAREMRQRPLAWFSIVWIGAHLALIASTDNWWGGYSFGPRLLTDMLPAFVLLTFLVWSILTTRTSVHFRRVTAVAFLLLGLVGIYINSYQGLYNESALQWNGSIPPDVEKHPSHIFDWRYPQFLATSHSLCQRQRAYMQPVIATETLVPYQFGSSITPSSDSLLSVQLNATPPPVLSNPGIGSSSLPYSMYLPFISVPGNTAFFVGWAQSTGELRWSVCDQSQILFMLTDLAEYDTYTLQILAGSYTGQDIDVSVNGHAIGSMRFPAEPQAPAVAHLIFDGTLLQSGKLNEITFHVDGFIPPSTGKLIFPGLSLRELSITPDH